MDFLTDLAGYIKVGDDTAPVARHSTNKKAGQELDMSDYMNLMVATFKNQSIDDVASTSDMMNQMVQMTVVQAVNNLNKIVSESNGMAYAASLVGKEVTIGVQDGYDLSTVVGKVSGTGMLDGEQVVFLDDGSMFKLSEIIAVGRLPGDAAASGLTLDPSIDTSLMAFGPDERMSIRNNAPLDADDLDPVTAQDRLPDAGTDYSGENYDYVTDANGSIRVIYRDQEQSQAGGADPNAVPNEAYEAAAEELRNL